MALSSLGVRIYTEVVLQALMVESNLHRMNALRIEFQEPEDKKLRKKHDLGVRGENFKHKENCPRCQKFHPGKPCDRGNQKCSTCGGKDHMTQDCPKGPMCFNYQQMGHLSKTTRKEGNSINLGRTREAKNHDEVGCII